MKQLFLMLLGISISVSAWAQNKAQRELIESDVRPSPELIMSNPGYFRSYPARSSFNSMQFKHSIPQLIVGLEKAFPGSKYAFLGRDMDLIADMVEAFYLSIGQTDRVARIKISTPSVENTTSALVTDFLIQTGLDADPNSHTKPLVMVDYTSFGSSSQSTIITRAVFRGLKARGIPREDVLNRFNIATIHSSLSVKTINTNGSQEEVSKGLQEQQKYFVKHGKVDQIVRVPIANVAYGSEWHDRYTKLRRNNEGVVISDPNTFFSPQKKAIVLRTMIEAIKMATTKTFQKDVAKLARAEKIEIAGLGEVRRETVLTEAEKLAKLEQKKIQLEQQRMKREEEKSQLQKDLLSELEKVALALPEIKNTDEYTKQRNSQGQSLKLTANGLVVWEALTNFTKADHYYENSLDFLARLYNDNKIGARDFRRIFIEILEVQEIKDPAFVKGFRENYRRFLPLEIAMGKSDVREKYQELNGIAGKNYGKLLGRGNSALPLSCKFLLIADVAAQ